MSEKQDITTKLVPTSIRVVHLPDCFQNATNRLVASKYDAQMKIMLKEEINDLMCDHIKRIVDGAKSFRVSIIDKMTFLSISNQSKRHKFIRQGIRDAIRLTSWLTFKDFINDFTKINLNYQSGDIVTFPQDKFKLISGDNSEHPRRTTEFVTIFKKIIDELDKIPAYYKRSGRSIVNVDIPNNPKISQLHATCQKYLQVTKDIRKYFRALEKLVHQEVQDGIGVTLAV